MYCNNLSNVTEEEKGPLLYLLYWRRERTFTIFVVLVRERTFTIFVVLVRERTFTIFVVLVTFLIMSEIWDILIEWLNDWFEVALHNESHRISDIWLPVIAKNDIKVYKKYQIDDVYLLSVMQHVYYIKMCQIIYDFVLLFYR